MRTAFFAALCLTTGGTLFAAERIRSNWQIVRTVPAVSQSAVSGLTFDRDSVKLAIVDGAGNLRVIHLAEKAELWRLEEAFPFAANLTDIWPLESISVATGDADIPGTIQLVSWKDGKVRGTAGDYAGSRNGVAFDPIKALLVWAAPQNEIHGIHFLKKRMLDAPIRMHVKPVHAVAIAKTADQIMTAGEDHRGGTFNLRQGTIEQPIFAADFALIDVAVHPKNSKIVAYASSGGVVYIHIRGSSGSVKRLDMPAKYVSNVRFDPRSDDTLFATAGGVLCSFELTTGEKIGQQRIGKPVYGFACSPNGEWLAAGHSDGTVTLLKRHTVSGK